MKASDIPAADDLVPDEVIPHQHLPPLRYRDLPAPISWTRMVGPSIVLAGLALGSGEYILWPYIVYKSGFVFFWACMLGVFTQFFLNLEIERWTLATGETAITGFCRMSPHWAWIMLAMTTIPWAWPGWATGAGEIISWMVFGPVEAVENGQTVYHARHSALFGIAGLLLVGVVLTAGPVVYNTVERLQTWLVGAIVVLVLVVAVMVVRADAWTAMFRGVANVGTMPDLGASGLGLMTLLGALAFAGAGGTMNLGQSNYIRDKGYGMGQYIGRITSPLTGNEEAVASTGFHFRHTPENRDRWRAWWRAANIEHFSSFFLTCVFCLCLLALVSYSLFYTEQGTLREGAARYGREMNFVWGEAELLAERPHGAMLKACFLLAGIALLLTTELGVLDAVARIATDIVKVNWLRDSERWSASRIYFWFLWGEIALGAGILSVPGLNQPFLLLKTSAAMNGVVMFLYSLLLLWLNNRVLPRSLGMSPTRFVMIVWSCAFFGYFSIQALSDLVRNLG